MRETIRAAFTISLAPSDELRWRRRCLRKDVRHTTEVQQLILQTMKAENEPPIEPGTKVSAELRKLRRK